MTDSLTAAAYREQHGGYEDEHELQQAVCETLDLHGVPFYAIPNGQYRPGQRPEAGIQKGVPDLCIPVLGHIWDDRASVRRLRGALYIELKQPKRYTREEQRAWLDALTEAGNACKVCRSVEDVLSLWRRYSGHPGTERLTKDDLWPEQR